MDYSYYDKPNRLIGTMAIIGILSVMMYSYSRLSWGFIIPSLMWGGILAFGIISMVLAHLLQASGRLRVALSDLFVALMLCVILFNHNFDIKQIGFASSCLPLIGIFSIYFYCKDHGYWIGVIIKMMKLFGLFYAFMTFICVANNQFYYNKIVPLMWRYNTSFKPHPSAGLTAHYSTNGIYLAMGFVAFVGTTFFRRGYERGISFREYFAVFVMGIALLMNGKRGILLCLVAAIFIAYRNYTILQKRGRVFKGIAIMLLFILLIYILSNFVPSILYFVERFVEEGQKRDISNGRFVLWTYTINLIKRDPSLFGKGWRWFRYNNRVFPGNDVHNCFLQLILENGFLGAVPFIVFIVVSAIRAFCLSLNIEKNPTLLSGKEHAHVYIALINEIYMIFFMFEGTSLYMPECLITYFISCTITEFYIKKVRIIQIMSKTPA